MAAGFFLSLAPGVAGELAGNRLELRDGGRRVALANLSSGLADAWGRLAGGGAQAAELADAVQRADGVAALARFYYDVDRLAASGWLVESVRQDDRTLATLVRLSQHFDPHDSRPPERFVLSRFALVRRVDDRLVLESPLGHARILLQDAAAIAAVHALVDPCSVAALPGRVPDLDEVSAEALVEMLRLAGALAPVTADGRSLEDVDSPLQSWAFHDLLFHTRSRIGRHDAAVGASFRLASTPPPPAFRPPHEGETIALPVPDMSLARLDDPPFAAVQERRRSVRRYGSPAIGAGQLGNFLYRAAAVRDTQSGSFDAPGGPIAADFTVRPYPSGGSLYELEIYVAVAASADLARGVYHYDARAHRLVRLESAGAHVDALVRGAAARAGIDAGTVQTLIHVTARFDRVAWKYESMAYALVLKHVGVLYQTMYLVAAALDLAPCAIGSGDSDLFARATGIDYFSEGLVGEFLLGTRPAD